MTARQRETKALTETKASTAQMAVEIASETLNKSPDAPDVVISQAINARRKPREKKVVETPPKKSEKSEKPPKRPRKTAKQREQEARDELKAAQREIEALKASQAAQSEQDAQDVYALKLTVVNMVHSLAVQVIDSRLIPQEAWPLDYREQAEQHRALNQAGVAAMDYFLPDETINPGVMYAVALGGFVLSNRRKATPEQLPAPADQVPPPRYVDGTPAPDEESAPPNGAHTSAVGSV